MSEIQFRTGKTIEQVAEDLGYSRSYLNDQINKGSNKRIKDALITTYGAAIDQNVISDKKEAQDRQEEILANLKELTKTVRQSEAAIRAEMRGFFHRQYWKEANYDDEAFLKAKDEADRIYLLNLKRLLQEDSM